MFENIKKTIELEINPQLKLHAGTCELVDFDAEGIATIRIFGGCAGCPSSTMALFQSIVPQLQAKHPEILDVILA